MILDSFKFLSLLIITKTRAYMVYSEGLYAFSDVWYAFSEFLHGFNGVLVRLIRSSGTGRK